MPDTLSREAALEQIIDALLTVMYLSKRTFRLFATGEPNIDMIRDKVGLALAGLAEASENIVDIMGEAGISSLSCPLLAETMTILGTESAWIAEQFSKAVH